MVFISSGGGVIFSGLDADTVTVTVPCGYFGSVQLQSFTAGAVWDWCFQHSFWEITVQDLISWRYLDSVLEMTVLTDSGPTISVGNENKQQHTEVAE